MMDNLVCLKYCKCLSDKQTLSFSPDDLSAFAYALKHKVNGNKKNTITVISMGPPTAETSLHDLYCYGADRVFLITDSNYAGSDTLATSYILSNAILQIFEKKLPEVILCGSKTYDSSTGQIGPGIAERLNVHYIGDCDHIDIDKLCLINNDYTRTELKKSVVVSINQKYELPFPTLPLIQSARNANVEIITNKQLNLPIDLIGIQGSPTRVIELENTKQSINNNSEISGSIEEKIDVLKNVIRKT